MVKFGAATAKPVSTMDDKDKTIANLLQELKDTRKERDRYIDLNFNLTKENQTLQKREPELDIDGFQKWVKTLNPVDHIEKPFIVQLQKYGHMSWLSYFKSLYQKYQKK